MQKKFRSITAARKFAKTTKMKVKQGKVTKLADGTKARWYTLTKGAEEEEVMGTCDGYVASRGVPMARPTKKAISKAQEASKALDRIFAEVDPNLILAGLLGGTATAGGIIPPFTRLMVTMGGSSQDIDMLINALKAGGYGYAGLGGVLPGLFAIYSGYSNKEPTTSGRSRSRAHCSLAVPSRLCSCTKRSRNPELMKTIIGMPAELLKGVGEIVPG